MRRVAVLRALPGLGDFLCSVPALRALAAAGFDVTLIGLPATRPLAERFGAYVEHFAEFPGWPGLPEVPVDPRRTVEFLAAAQEQHFDLALQLHGSGVASAGFVELLGAARTAGYVPSGDARAGGTADDVPFGDGHPLRGRGTGDVWLEWVENESEVRRPLRLLEHVAIPSAGEELGFPLTRRDEREAGALHLPRPYACLHAGSALPTRRWPPERFAAAADALSERGLTPVLTGTPAEADTVAAVASAVRAPHVSLVGRTSLGAMACVLRDSALVLTNDTGASHLAAAVSAPSVIVHTVTDPARWAPLDRTLHRPLRGDVPVDAVLTEADALLTAA